MTPFDFNMLQVSPLHLCSYLPDRASRLAYLPTDAATLDHTVFTQLSQLGFRRSGKVMYRPACHHCQQCISCRIAVSDFRWTRRYRKVLKRNANVSVRMLSPDDMNEEHYQLYAQYIAERHVDGDMYPPSKHTFDQFLLSSPVQTYYMEIRHSATALSEPSKLLAIAVIDSLGDGLSSVYSFFATDMDLRRRSLGVLCILKQIQLCHLLNVPYLYLGYWVPENEKMRYKSDFLPLQLYINDHWQHFNESPTWAQIKPILHTDPAVLR